MTLREWVDSIADDEEEKIMLADGFDDAILGLVRRVGQPIIVVYDRSKCIDILMKRDGMSFDEATEFFEFNTEGAWMGEGTPGFLLKPD